MRGCGGHLRGGYQGCLLGKRFWWSYLLEVFVGVTRVVIRVTDTFLTWLLLTYAIIRVIRVI